MWLFLAVVVAIIASTSLTYVSVSLIADWRERWWAGVLMSTALFLAIVALAVAVLTVCLDRGLPA